MRARLGGVVDDSKLLHDYGQSNFEICCSALCDAGLLAGEGHYWRIVDGGQLPLVDGEIPQIVLNKLLHGLAAHLPYMSESDRDFDGVAAPNIAFESVCHALVESGYAEAETANCFTWTDSFGPWMVLRGNWSLASFEMSSKAEVDAVLSVVPGSFAHELASLHYANEQVFLRRFFGCFRNGAWLTPGWCNVPDDGWDMRMAAAMYVHFQRAGIPF